MRIRAALFAIAMASAAAAQAAYEADLLVGYDQTYASGLGGTDNAEVAIANAVAGSNLINEHSGTGARMKVVGFHQAAQYSYKRTSNGGFVGWLANYDSRLSDVVDAGNALNADLVTFVCESTADGAAAVASQPGRFSSFDASGFWSAVLAHETGGHNYGRSHSDGITSPKTVMLHNYCSGGSAPPYYFTNPKIWWNGRQLISDTNSNCGMGSVINGGDNSQPSADSSQGVANRYEHLEYGPNLSNVVSRWQFTNAVGSAPTGTAISNSAAGGAAATVLGAGATFTGSALRLPGGGSASGAAYVQLPAGLVSGKTNITVEIWATPLSAQNYARVFDAGSGSANYVTLSACIGTSLSRQRFESKIAGITNTLDSSVATTAGVPHHYAITYASGVGAYGGAGGGRWRWYRDGDRVAYLDVSNALSGIPDTYVWLGRSMYSGDSYANCDYKEVRVSDVALTDAQIAGNCALGPNYAQGATTLGAGDALGTTSFNAAGQWSGGVAPAAGSDYQTQGFTLRTPATASSYAFAGKSLTVSGGRFLYKGTAGTITVTNLVLQGALVQHGSSGTFALAGRATVGTDGATFDAANGAMTMTASLAGAGDTLYVNNTVTLGGSNSAFTGRTLIGNGNGGTVAIDSEARLGPNPASLVANQLTLNRGTLQTTATMALDDTSRGILLDISGGRFDVATATTLTISCPLSSPDLGTSITAGSLMKSGAGTLVLSSTNSTFEGMLYVDTGSTTASAGALRVANNKVMAAAHSPIYIQNNNSGSSTLQLDGSSESIVLPQRVYLSGRSGTVPAIQNIAGTNSVAGVAIWSGGANYTLQSDSGLLTFNGTISSGSTGTRTVTFTGNGNIATTGKVEDGTADQLNLVKSGTGTLMLAGTTTPTGTVSANAGTLNVNTVFAGTNTLTVASTATLSGTGSLAAAVTVFGTHAPGATTGTQTFSGPLAYAATSKIGWNLQADTTLASSANKVAAADVTVTAGAKVNLAFNGAGSAVDFAGSFWTQPQQWPVVVATSVTGTFALGTISADSKGRTVDNYGVFSLQHTATQVLVVFTPYPALEVWQRVNFGTKWNDSAVAGDTADADRDGLPNLVEHGMGTDPNRPNQTAAAGVSGNRLTIGFTRNTAATGSTLSVWGSSDPWTGWTELARSTAGAPFTLINPAATVSESGAGTARDVQVGDAFLIGDPAASKRFLKLQVTH